jgi:hypothetical protein
MMTGSAPPHSRWLVRRSVDQLAATYDDVAVAVAALTRATILRNSASARPTIGQRIAGRRGWLRTVWLGAMILLTALFMAWISVRLAEHLFAAPAAVGVLPGLLLTLTLTGTTGQAARSPAPWPGLRVGAAVVRPWALLAGAVASSIVWTTLWLAIAVGAAVWVALACGTALVAAVTAGMLAAARPAVAAAIVGKPLGTSLPRRRLIQLRRAQRRLRNHTRKWHQTAHQYSVVISDGNEAATALVHLISGDVQLALDGCDSYDTLILTALRRYRPAPLTASLDAAVRALHNTSPHSTDARG